MYNGKTVTAIIVAAGSGTRMGRDKMLIDLFGKSVLSRSVEAFAGTGFFDEIVVVSSEKNMEIFKEELREYSVKVVLGGATRGESSLSGINASTGEILLIHDGARPLITKEIIENTLVACIETGCAAAGVKSKDTIKTVTSDNIIEATVDRETAVLIQTPQAFRRELIKSAYEKFGFEMTDDCALMEKMGAKIKITPGSYENIKITTAEDLVTAEGILRKRGIGGAPVRIGTGFDTHKLVEGRPLIIGGVNIPYEKGLFGHSDADVLIHAVIDALFGAAALGDIGKHFPDTDEKYKGADSMLLLQEAAREVREHGYEIGNIDVTLIAQAPKMAPHIDGMRENLAKAMNISTDAVSIKAKTNEHMGFTGRGEGIEARAVALIRK
ncbi:MAG: 2-C-methyl-D-erythritol 2,4-cyclodiphosphate synthase [Ruminococcaceae bacterium]|nr:2-C-methyl-D-erythritol 2,4-cyclodiphosphate synthase [Oscillospiraceae bacterium]